MANEAKTSQLFRKLLKEKGYYDDKDIIVEEQQTDNKKLTKLLQNASKSGAGKGFPDFIITCGRYPDLVILVECKADTKYHESATLDSFREYAIDGALLYASFVSKEYDVIAIGFSGEKAPLTRQSHYIQLNGEKDYHQLFNEGELLDIDSYHHGLMQSTFKFNQDFNKLIDYTKEVNEELQNKKIKERLRALLISGILIALKNERFKAEYKNYHTTAQLVSNMYSAICAELRKSDVPERNKESLVKGYEFITTNPSINNPSAEVKKYVTDLISNCDERINGFMVTHKYIDTISQFYVEFLRYANNDKGLGIVLTPPHITELFCELAQVDKDSVVLDNCAGTGGFLVSAMKKMLENANNDIAKEQHIKDKQLIGIEYDEEIYTLLISNMIVHRDGRTNILRDDCFNVVAEELKERFHPTVGLLNPPYKNKSKGTEELEFVLNNLSMLEKGGRCVAIMPISCVNDVSGKSYLLKQKILQEHTLEAVLSLPEELFHNSNVNTVTCAVVLTAHVPHPANKKTWFGYCRNDGFVKRKNKGRIDANHTWQQIKDQWVSAYMNREVIPEFSVMKQVTAKDEWCAEAYLDTQYDRLTEEDFLDTVKNFYLFNIKSAEENITDGED
jgi:type I restriction-modification system DNA methylase subunit